MDGVKPLAALGPAALLAVDPTGWFPFGPVKWLLVSTLLLAGAALRLVHHPLRVPRPLAVALALLVGCMAGAAAVGLDPVYAWTGTPERHLGVVTWALLALALAVGTTLDADADGPTLAAGLAVAGMGLGGVATLEALGWEPDVLQAGSRLTGTFGSSAYLGAAAMLLLPLCGGAAAEPKLPRWTRGASLAAVPLLSLALIGSGARAAWLGLAVGGLALGVGRRGWLADHRGTVWRAGLVVVAVGAAVVAFTPAGARLADLADPGEPGGQGRVDEWRVAARVVAEHPLTGVGPEGYRIAFGGAVDAAYERAHGREQQPDRAHSGPLDVALSGGLPALAAWAVVIWFVGRAVRRLLGSGGPWLTGVAVALVAHLTGQLLLFPLAELEPVTWLLAGLVVASTRTDPPARPAPRTASVVLGALAAVAAVVGVTDVVADRRAGSAIDALDRGDHRGAAAAAREAVDLRPDIVRLHVLAASAYVADEQGTVAGLAELDAALDVSPGDPIVLLHRAGLLVDRAEATQVPAHLEEADDEVRRLLADDPYNAALWRLAARVAALGGDVSGAEAAIERADDLTPVEQLER